MKKQGILHHQLAALMASPGHGDSIVIADCGLPVPKGVTCVDLAVTQGVPSFLAVLDAILFEMVVEKYTIAKELDHNPVLKDSVITRLTEEKVKTVPHDELKVLSQSAKAIIRTGEGTPYANVILYAGVAF